MVYLLGVLILASLVVLQTAVFSHVILLNGTADLVMLAVVAWSLQKKARNTWIWAIIGGLLVGYVSAIPFWASLVGYLLAAGVAILLKRRVWQVPFLAMIVATLCGSLIMNWIVVAALRIAEVPVSLFESLNQIILPGILLNLLLALPFYFLFTDLAGLLYPADLEM